jgi:hypothetical protein
MSRPRRLLLAAALAALAVPLGCGCGDGAKVNLRYHPPAGATYHYSLEQHTDMKFKGGPMAQLPEQQLTMHMHFTQTVTGATQGGIGVTVRFDSTTLDSPLMGANAYGPALDRMRGLTSNVVYDDRMNVVRAAVTNGGGTLSPIAEQFVRNLKGIAFPLPEGPVGVGDSWTAELELPINQLAGAGSPMKTTTKLTVKAIDASGSDTTVLVALKTSFPRDPIKILQEGQMVTLKLSGSLKGEQLFSVRRGAVVRSLWSGTMRINMTGGVVGGDGSNMTMQQATSLQLLEAK